MKDVQITVARRDNVTEVHLMIVDSRIRCCHGSARRHPNDDDVPFLGVLTAMTRAITNGVAAHDLTPDEGRQVVLSLCQRASLEKYL